MTNKELLEKMSWLYEQGFRPDQSYEPPSTETGFMPKLTFMPDMDIEFDDEGRPWFSESCLWSLLPEDMRILSRKLTEIHSALLDLVIWCVKEQGLKPEVKG